jgi:hypothetical protein
MDPDDFAPAGSALHFHMHIFIPKMAVRVKLTRTAAALRMTRELRVVTASTGVAADRPFRTVAYQTCRFVFEGLERSL